jgi:hypothetical protein
MQLLKAKRSGKTKAGAKPARKRARKPVQRIKREGVGRPSLHPGKDLSRHASAYLTEEGWEKLAECQQLLLDRQKMDLQSVTVSDAIEEGIHRLYRDLTRAH